MNVSKQGETVKLVYTSASTAVGIPTSAVTVVPQQVGVYDADNNTRVLQPWERLLIDSMQGFGVSGQAWILSGSTYAQSTILGFVNGGAADVICIDDGLSLPMGVYPFVVATTSTAAFTVVGVARIINGKTQGVRPNWRESLVAQGNS